MDTFFSCFFKKLYKSNLKINIIGDVLIDEYYQVDDDRNSPDFPIPVPRSFDDKPNKIF